MPATPRGHKRDAARVNPRFIGLTGRAMGLLRRVVPSTALLTRFRLPFLPLDLVDRVVGCLFPETRGLPPARFRVRTGTANRLLFNQVSFRYFYERFWKDAFLSRWVEPKSAVVELGSGCGRGALGLCSSAFSGSYLGVDVDEEMVAWCNERFHRTSASRSSTPSAASTARADGATARSSCRWSPTARTWYSRCPCSRTCSITRSRTT